MREFLKGLELEKETIDKIMSEHGRKITEANEELQEYKMKNKSLEDKVVELGSKSTDSQKIQEELDALKKSIEEETNKKKQEEEDKMLSNNIKTAFGEKKFVNEYTEKQIENEIKNALKDTNNVGKSAKEIFEEMTKDKDGIFVNPNQVIDMTGNQPVDKAVNDESKMRELIGLKTDNK